LRNSFQAGRWFSDASVYQGSGTVPNACAGGQVRLNQGGSFSTFITLN